MSSSLFKVTAAAVIAVVLSLSSQAFAQDDQDPEMRIQKLEEQLRQLTGQNEELQFRNRQLEDRLRQMGSAPSAPNAAQVANQPTVTGVPPAARRPRPARASRRKRAIKGVMLRRRRPATISLKAATPNRGISSSR